MGVRGPRSVCAVAAVVVAAAGMAQAGAITGRVTDARSGQPLAKVAR